MNGARNADHTAWTHERFVDAIVKITRLYDYQTWQTHFLRFTRFAKVRGLIFFLIVLFECWLVMQANSGHVEQIRHKFLWMRSTYQSKNNCGPPLPQWRTSWIFSFTLLSDGWTNFPVTLIFPWTHRDSSGLSVLMPTRPCGQKRKTH